MQEIPPLFEIGAGIAKLLVRIFGKDVSAAFRKALEHRDEKRQISTTLDVDVVKLYANRVLGAARELPLPDLADLADAAMRRGVLKDRNLKEILAKSIAQIPDAVIKEQNETVSDEFLDTFESIAENQSTEHMQDLFARILAGEIQNPSSFSRRSLRVAEQLDQSTAALFQRLCSMAFVRNEVIGLLGGQIVVDITDLVGAVGLVGAVDKVVSGLEGDPSNNSLSSFGLDFLSLSRLAEYGLILPGITQNTPYRICVAPYPGNAELSVTQPIEFQGRSWSLRSMNEDQSFEDFKISGVGFSAIGNELFQVVDQIPVPEYHSALVEFFQSKGLEMRICNPTRGSVFQPVAN